MLTILNDLAVIQVFVDDTLWRPIKRVSKKSGRVLGQCSNTHPNGANFFELSGQTGADYTHETRRKTALRCHHTARRLAQLLGGRLELSSRVGEGTTLTFTLPTRTCPR